MYPARGKDKHLVVNPSAASRAMWRTRPVRATYRWAVALGLCLVCTLAYGFQSTSQQATSQPRARDIGVPFDGTPGPLNAITDVPGVEVGEVTLIKDLPDGHKVRTGVTAILPRGQEGLYNPVFAAWSDQNGNGQMTGIPWMQSTGRLTGPIMLTNTHSVGVVNQAAIDWLVQHHKPHPGRYVWYMPLVTETYDGILSDINGFHVHADDALKAIQIASGGPVGEGNVGGGTGNICHLFKCGTGTSSRSVKLAGHTYTVGVLVQANYGGRRYMTIAGVPVGKYMPIKRGMFEHARKDKNFDRGSIIIVIATDAPLLPKQLKRLAKRAGMGLALTGSASGNSSGDLFVAFSTANPQSSPRNGMNHIDYIGNDHINPLFRAVVQAVPEAIVNSMIAARDMTGENGIAVKAISHAKLIEVLKRFNRYAPPH